jgi:hypothetical protein
MIIFPFWFWPIRQNQKPIIHVTVKMPGTELIHLLSGDTIKFEDGTEWKVPYPKKNEKSKS